MSTDLIDGIINQKITDGDKKLEYNTIISPATIYIKIEENESDEDIKRKIKTMDNYLKVKK